MVIDHLKNVRLISDPIGDLEEHDAFLLLDSITAATAFEYDLTLVTRNTADYDDIPGLRLHA